MTVSAKFVVESVTDFGSDTKSVKMRAVTSGDGKGNETWSKYTPSGTIEMFITNPDASVHFKPTEFVHLTFSFSE